MKTFVVSYVSFFDNEMKIAKVEAKNVHGAVIQALRGFGASEEWIVDIPVTEDDDEFKQYFFDCDSVLGWLEL